MKIILVMDINMSGTVIPRFVAKNNDIAKREYRKWIRKKRLSKSHLYSMAFTHHEVELEYFAK